MRHRFIGANALTLDSALVLPPWLTDLGIEDDEMAWTKYTTTYTALSSGEATLLTLASREVLEDVVVKHSVKFEGGALTGYTVSVGIASDEDKFTVAFDAFQAVGDLVFDFVEGPFLESFATDTAVKVYAEGIGAAPSAATAGSVDIWIRTSRLWA